MLSVALLLVGLFIGLTVLYRLAAPPRRPPQGYREMTRDARVEPDWDDDRDAPRAHPTALLPYTPVGLPAPGPEYDEVEVTVRYRRRPDAGRPTPTYIRLEWSEHWPDTEFVAALVQNGVEVQRYETNDLWQVAAAARRVGVGVLASDQQLADRARRAGCPLLG